MGDSLIRKAMATEPQAVGPKVFLSHLCQPPLTHERHQIALQSNARKRMPILVPIRPHVRFQPTLSGSPDGQVWRERVSVPELRKLADRLLHVAPEAHPLVPAALKESDIVAPAPLEHSLRQFHSTLLSAEGRRTQLDA